MVPMDHIPRLIRHMLLVLLKSFAAETRDDKKIDQVSAYFENHHWVAEHTLVIFAAVVLGCGALLERWQLVNDPWLRRLALG